MEILLTIVGTTIGLLIGWLLARLGLNDSLNSEKELAQHKIKEIENEFLTLKATSNAQLQTARDNAILKQGEINDLNLRLKEVQEKYIKSSQELATYTANNAALNEKLETQKKEIEKLGEKFNTEFENIANRILDTKTEKFTELNKSNMKDLLDPLGQNISEFKKTVADVYDKESKERFSLEEKVKELALLNKVISDEARNLTNALKGEAKTQGRWGEMILESILEKSGLRKGEEYFMEYELRDDDGNALKSDSENKKMRPDAVIKYPDNRSVIIDSKVSLNAFTRYLAAGNMEVQKVELAAHVTAVKTHILTLSSRGYDDYDKSLDFVMMFIPSEPAYIAAQQGDPDLWNFAYEKRIVLINPTNLIISLKLIVDLWKREYQNKNAQEIAKRGTLLYDKFVGFVKNLEGVGAKIEDAKTAWTASYGQLSSGSGNLISQAESLKELGVKSKKELSKDKIAKARELSTDDLE